MFEVSFYLAFGAGILSFFAPCVFPLLPAYISYMTGVSYEELYKDNENYRVKVLLSVLSFVVGFSTVFVLMGAGAGGIGIALRSQFSNLSRFAGVLIILAGLSFGGFINIGMLQREIKLNLPKRLKKASYLRTLLIGVAFGLSWTPCIGAVLGSILTLAAATETAYKGALLLATYSLGISIPFILIAFAIASLPRFVRNINKYLPTVTKVSAIILIIIGILLVTDTYKYVNSYIFDLALNNGYDFWLKKQSIF